MSQYIPPQGGNASFPTVGILTPQQYTIWESGGVYAGMRNTDGFLLASGTNCADVFKTVLDANNNDYRGVIQLKSANLILNSGVTINENVIIKGEGAGGTGVTFSGITGRVSGAFIVTGNGVEFRDFYFEMGSGVMNGIVLASNDGTLKIDNISFVGDTNSGTRAIHMPAGFDCFISNCEIDTFDEGIRLDNSIDTTNNIRISDIVHYTNNTAIMLDNVASNYLTNIIVNNNASGGIIIQGSSAKRNIIDRVSASNSGIPAVVVKTSGELNRITNIEHRSSAGYPILDLTSGCRNFLLPGHIDTNTVVISGASPFTYVNASGRQEMIYVGGGTVSQIDFIRRSNTIALSGLTAGTFILDGGDKLTVTYSAAPAIKVFPIG